MIWLKAMAMVAVAALAAYVAWCVVVMIILRAMQ